VEIWEDMEKYEEKCGKYIFSMGKICENDDN